MTVRRGRSSASTWASTLGVVLGVCLIAAGGLVLYAESRLSSLVLGGLGESFSTRLYSAPYALADGSTAPPERVLARLERLDYRRVAGEPAGPGEFEWQPPGQLTVWLRGFDAPVGKVEAGRRDLEWRGDRWSLSTSSAPVVFEPELAAELSGAKKVRREPAASEEIPDALKHAVIAAEDRRFYSHWGIDPRGIARALWHDVSGRAGLQGGSTITQQLSKNLFLTPKRTFKRKLAEAGLALYLELRFSKDRILTLYLNDIYLGQQGPVSVAGVKAAARFYFGKRLNELTIAECATIAGLIRSPYRYNPFRDPEQALSRRDFVLGNMRDEGFITDAQLEQERARPLGVKESPQAPGQARDADYFSAEVVRQLLPRFGEETLYRHGLAIYTTMDALLQRDAQRAVSAARPQAALVAIDPANGNVLALSGGRDFARSQFNRATQARRQPGSAFKPFVYGAALERGLTAATILEDKPRQYARDLSSGTWDPRNYEGVYFGTATVRQALAHSLNAATLDLEQKIGVPAVVEFARRMGIESPLREDLGLALGDSEVTLLELTAAYAPFADGGFRSPPRLVVAVVDAEGSVLEDEPPRRDSVLDAATAFLMTSLLQSVVAQGTGKPLAAWGWSRPTAAKTGTTNDGRDAWFVGYTPSLLAGAWVGDDQHRSIRATGAKNALPVWVTFMKAASQDFERLDFSRPAGLVDVVIDPQSGLRAVSGYPQRVTEIFKDGTQPTQDCPLHAGGIKGFFRRWFGR